MGSRTHARDIAVLHVDGVIHGCVARVALTPQRRAHPRVSASPIMDADTASTRALHAAASAGDAATVEQLLESIPAHVQDEADGVSALMLAAGGGHLAIVELLLAAGAPWNAVDRRGRCAGNHALDNSQQHVVDFLVDAAVKAELQSAGKVPPEGMVEDTCRCFLSEVHNGSGIEAAQVTCKAKAAETYGL